jgi:Rrf2 family protein
MLSNTHFSMALHVLSALAYRDELVGSDHLASTMGTNPSFLRGLIGRLKNAGLVETQLGKGGGARLARPATKITLRDIYIATESQPAVKTHDCDDTSECPVAAGMRPLLEHVRGRVEKAVESELKRITVADLIAGYIGRDS